MAYPTKQPSFQITKPVTSLDFIRLTKGKDPLKDILPFFSDHDKKNRLTWEEHLQKLKKAKTKSNVIYEKQFYPTRTLALVDWRENGKDCPFLISRDKQSERK